MTFPTGAIPRSGDSPRASGSNATPGRAGRPCSCGWSARCRLRLRAHHLARSPMPSRNRRRCSSPLPSRAAWGVGDGARFRLGDPVEGAQPGCRTASSFLKDVGRFTVRRGLLVALSDLADATGLTTAFTDALRRLRPQPCGTRSRAKRCGRGKDARRRQRGHRRLPEPTALRQGAPRAPMTASAGRPGRSPYVTDSSAQSASGSNANPGYAGQSGGGSASCVRKRHGLWQRRHR